MGYVDLPDQPPAAGGKLQGTIVLDEQELRVTVGLLKDALAELTKGMANGVSHAAAAPPAATPSPAAAVPAATAAQAGPRAASMVQQPRPASTAAPAGRAGLPAHLANMQPPQQPRPVQAPPQQQQQAVRPPPQQQPQQPRPQAPQQQPRPAPLPTPMPAPAPVPAPVAAPVAQPVPAAPRPQQQRQPPPQQQRQAPAPAAAPPQPREAVGAVAAAPAAASSHWKLAYSTEAEEHGGQVVAAVAYAKSMPGLPGGDGHSGWLVTSSKGVLNLWETSRAVPGETVLLCMHSQAVDFTSTRLVLEPSTKLMYGASLTSSDASECVSVHSLDVEVGLLSYRYKFGPPVQQPKAGQQRLMQQVVSLHGMNPGVRNTVMTSYGERLLLFSTKDSAKVPANTLVHQSKMHFVAHQGSTITALQTSQGIEGCHNLISGAMDGKIHIWDLSQPPRDNSPAMKLYRHSQTITGLAQITDERLVSGSTDGSVMLWDLRQPAGPLYTQRTPGNAGVLRIAPGPWGDVMAVSTAKGLHCVELFDFDAPMTNIAAFPLQRPFTDLVFNAVTHDLYAGSSTGSISVFSRRA